MNKAALLSASLVVSACGGAVESNGGDPGGSSDSSGAAGAGSSIEVIDDLDNTDGRPTVPDGSSSFFWRGGLGNWFVTTSDGVTQDAVIEETADGDRACHVSGGGDGLGSDLWAQLHHPDGGAVDLSAYAGIAFEARLSGGNKALFVGFGADGRFFTDPETIAGRTLAVSDEWQRFELSFADAGLEATGTSSIDFVVTQADEPFELWVDELAFRCNGTCPEQ